MAFSLDQFYQINRRALIWLALLGVLWLLRDFFGLVFLTFVLAFVATPLVRFGQRRLRLRYHVALVVVYVLFLVLLGSFVRYVTPNVIGEINRLLGNLPTIEARIVGIKNDLVEKYPAAQKPLLGYLRSALDEKTAEAVNADLQADAARLGLEPNHLLRYYEKSDVDPAIKARLDEYHAREEQLLIDSLAAQLAGKVRERAPQLINLLYRGTVTTLLALLFSFMVLVDIRRLSELLRGLRASRLRDVYEEAAQPIVRLTYIVGRSIQAQAVIALVNTCLTLLGLVILGIPSIAMLSVIVFVCSFIPVLGVFISTTPIVLVALNVGDFGLALTVIGLIVLIHAIEAYFLNPLIYGQHLKLNPVLVLIILFIGYHGFGVWGMLLGVPVARYVLNDVLGVPLWNDRSKVLAPAAPRA